MTPKAVAAVENQKPKLFTLQNQYENSRFYPVRVKKGKYNRLTNYVKYALCHLLYEGHLTTRRILCLPFSN